MRNFDEWLNTFTDNIATYSYYVDFEKVISNADKLKVELNILNSLIDVEEGKQMTHDEYCAYMKELNRRNRQFEPTRRTDLALDRMEESRIKRECQEAKELEDFLKGFAKKTI